MRKSTSNTRPQTEVEDSTTVEDTKQVGESSQVGESTYGEMTSQVGESTYGEMTSQVGESPYGEVTSQVGESPYDEFLTEGSQTRRSVSTYTLSEEETVNNLDFPLSRCVGRFSDEFDVDVISVTGTGIRIDTFQKGDPEYKVDLDLDDPILAMKLLVAPNTLRTLVAVQQCGTILFIPCTHGTGGDFLHAAYDYSNCTDENIRPLVTGRTLDRPLIAVDPIDKTVLIIAYPGVITFCKWSKERWQECDFTHVTHEERDVIDIDIVQKSPDKTVVVYLVRRKGTLGSPEVIHVYQALYNATEKSFEVLKQVECVGNYKLVYAMPLPVKGYLLVSTTKITFRSLEKKGPPIQHKDIMFKTEYKFDGIIDRSRVLFVDLNNRVVLLKLNYDEENLTFTSGNVDFVKHDEDIMFVSFVYMKRIVVQTVKHQPQYAKLVEMEEGRHGIQKYDGSVRPTNPPHQPFKEGQKLTNRFTLMNELGSGAYGTVYNVYDSVDEHTNFVLKAIAPHDEATYHRECAALAMCFSIPGVINLHYAFELDRNFCLVMRYAGEPIKLLLRRAEGHKFSMSNCIRIGYSVIKTLVAVHRIGFFHRDISGGNVLINFDDETKPVVKIIDFGVAGQFLNEIGERIPVVGLTQFRGRKYSELDDVMAVFDLILTMMKLDPIPVLDIAEDKEPELDFSKVRLPRDCAWLEHFYGFIQYQRKTGYDPKSILKCFSPQNTRNDVNPRSALSCVSIQLTKHEFRGTRLRRIIAQQKEYMLV